MLSDLKAIAQLSLEDKITFIEKVITNNSINAAGNPVTQQITAQRKRYFVNFLMMLVVIVATLSPAFVLAQTTDNIPIGQILDSMPTGIKLRDGTILKAEVINLGTAASSYTEHGLYNQYDFGGTYNGANDGLSTPTGPDGLGISGYLGDLNPLNFTRISANPRGDIDRGEISNFRNAIGFHIWADRPILAKQLLLIDCDGSNVSGNQEWFTIFGYNGTTAVDPSISLSASTELVQNTETVHGDWHTLVDGKITGSVPSFTTKKIAKNTTGATPAINDPDDIKNQALFDFGTSKADHLFILWGIRNDLAAGGHATTGIQNSGVSPLVFNFDFDFGDAPNTYGTNKAANGPVHVVPSPALLTLGTAVTTENDATPASLANTDSDDGVTTVDSVIGVSTLSDVITTYAITTTFNNTSGSAANFAAWIDWNNNNIFDAGEGKTATTAAGVTSGTVTFTWTAQTLTRSSLADNNTFARIRVTTEAITTAHATNTPFQDGEAEDYLIPFAAASSLPVRFVSFEGVKKEQGIVLNWKVADQRRIKHYEVLRSGDGREYRLLGTINAEEGRTSYVLTDELPLDGINLYQLRSLSLDGTYETAPLTLNIHNKTRGAEPRFYPNPGKHSIAIHLASGTPATEVVVRNAIGEQVLRAALNQGHNTIDVSHLQQGLYYFSVMNGADLVSMQKIAVAN